MKIQIIGLGASGFGISFGRRYRKQFFLRQQVRMRGKRLRGILVILEMLDPPQLKNYIGSMFLTDQYCAST